MGIFDAIQQLPYVYIWLPALVFFGVVGAVYRITRSAPAMAEAAAEAPAAPIPVATVKPKDQRNMFRRHGNPVEVNVGAPEDKKNLTIGSVLDRSMGGMRLALYQQVEVGVVLSVKPRTADDMVPWIDLEVRSCRPSTEMPDQYEVGCQYVKSPPYSIQLLFG